MLPPSCTSSCGPYFQAFKILWHASFHTIRSKKLKRAKIQTPSKYPKLKNLLSQMEKKDSGRDSQDEDLEPRKPKKKPARRYVPSKYILNDGKVVKLRGRRHFVQGGGSIEDDPDDHLTISTKADLMLESSVMDDKFSEILESELSNVTLGAAAPTALSSGGTYYDPGTAHGISHFQPGNANRTTPAKETNLWQRHHGSKPMKAAHGGMPSAPGSSSGGLTSRHRIGPGSLSSKYGSAGYLRRKPITHTQHDRSKRTATIDLEWYWYERSATERLILMFLMFLFILFLCHLSVAIYFIYTGIVNAVDYEECGNSSCVAFAEFITSRMDKSIDPCEDFYGHVCGSKVLPSDEQFQLQKAVNFRHFTIPFDFTKSTPLGEYMQNAKSQGAGFVLNYYKYCMDRRKREAEGLDGFKQVLNKVGLGNKSALISTSMNELLINWIRGNLAQQIFYFEYNPNGTTVEAIFYPQMCGNVECRYMSKPFAVYYDTAFKALRLAQTVFNIESEEEIVDIANDVICTEARLQNGRYDQLGAGSQSYTDNFLSDDIEEHCLNSSNWEKFRDKINMYDKDGEEKWDTKEIVCKIMKEYLSGPCDPTVIIPPSKYFAVLNEYFTKSTSYRVGRFLQWIALREMSADLTVEVFSLFYQWKVDDHRLMDFYCFERLFRAIPGTPTSHYVTVNMDEAAFITADSTSRRLDSEASDILQKLPIPKSLSGMNPTTIRTVLADLFWSDTETLLSAVRAKWLKSLSFQTLQYSYQLTEDDSHAQGIAELLAFQGRLQKISFVSLKDIPNFIFRDSHQRSVYAFRTRTEGIDGRTVVPPFGLGELPMFRYGLHVLDLGGYASYIAQEKIKYIFNWIMTEQWRGLSEVDASMQNILAEFKNVILSKTNASHEEVLKWGNNLERSDFKNVQLIANQFAVELAWQTLENVLATDGIESDLVDIKGLEQVYTFQQLFFLQYARVRCVNLNQEELEESMRVPAYTPWKIMVNGALANTKSFAETWQCTAKSKMNSSGKMNFLEP